MCRTGGRCGGFAAVPTIAFGAFMPHIVAMQFVAKVAGGAMWHGC